MNPLPSGTVTFLFTDIEGSTPLFQRHPDEMPQALARHHALVQRAIDAHGGVVFNVVGDGVCAAFPRAEGAVAAALAMQHALHHEPWGAIGPMRVRAGLHTGVAETEHGLYVTSLALARAQRVMAAGHGGQTLLSAATAAQVRGRLPAGTTLRDLGAHKLRGLAESEVLNELVASDLPSEFPPLRAETAAAAIGAPLDGLVRGALVGRGAELGILTQHWASAQQARGQLVLLSGEPGVGKTRLAQALIATARQGGAVILRGGCYEYEATTPYLPLVEALREWVRGQASNALRATLAGIAVEIAKLAPEIEAKLGELAPNVQLSAGEERLRLFDNVARLLRSLAAERGLLLFIDDLQWADHGTLALLRYALRHLRNDRVLVLATYREIELDRAHPLAAALVDWNRERLATRVALRRLSRADTAALVSTLLGQTTVSDEFVAALYGETEGNPFFVEEVVKSLIEQGQIYREAGDWNRKAMHEIAIPQSIKEAIGRRLARLSDATADTLRFAAALGKIFAFDDFAAVVPGDADTALDALDEATAAQLVRANDTATGAGQREMFAFTHDKIREVLYAELNPIRRRRLHQRIGEALERRYGGTADAGDEHAQDLAHHFAQAGDLARALGYSRRAANAAERVFAHEAALEHLAQARDCATALARPNELAAIDEQLGDIHEGRGMIVEAVDAYERALATVPTREARAELKVKIGQAYVPVGDPRGLARLQQALVELDARTQTNALGLATALVGRYHHYRTEHRKAIEFQKRALLLAEPFDDASTLSTIYSFLAGAHQHLIEYDESDRWARVCIALGERKGAPWATASGYEFLGENAAERGLWKEAFAYAERDAEAGRKVGSLARVAWSEFCRIQALHGTGELSTGYVACVAALASCGEIGEQRLACWLEPMAAQIAADLGDVEASLAHAERGVALARQLDQLLLCAWAQHGIGYAALRRDDLPAALTAYEAYLALVRDTENAIATNLIMARAAETLLRAGRIDEAAVLTERALSSAEAGGAPHYRALAVCMHGRVLMARARADKALAAFDEALAEFTALGSRLEAARTLYHRAALRIAQGDDSAGRRDARAAYDAFAAMGAAHDRAEAERLLA